MKNMKIIAAAALMALSLGACTQVRGWFGLDGEQANPFEAAESADVKVLAAYGIVTIALEEAAVVAENPSTPDAVVLAIARVAPSVKASADIARTAALEYRRARVAYEQARDAGLDTQTGLLVAVTQAGTRVSSTITDLRANLERLKSAFVRGHADPSNVEDASGELQQAQTLLAAS